MSMYSALQRAETSKTTKALGTPQAEEKLGRKYLNSTWPFMATGSHGNWLFDTLSRGCVLTFLPQEPWWKTGEPAHPCTKRTESTTSWSLRLVNEAFGRRRVSTGESWPFSCAKLNLNFALLRRVAWNE